MFIAHILEQLGLANSKIKALDLCAAPGGKSTLLNSYLGVESLLVSNEVIKARANILVDNINRWGTANVVVTNNDPSAFNRLPGYFDVLLVDAPCSGSGMFRKDQKAIDEWSSANVKLCSDRQKRILAESLSTLSTDGYLLYSTCSYSQEENEDIVDWVMDEFGFESVSIPVKADWGIEETHSPKHYAFGYRFYPHRVMGEGFFISVLKKRTSQSSFPKNKMRPEKSAISLYEAAKWVHPADIFFQFMHGDDLRIFPKAYMDDLRALQQVLYIKQAGTSLGKWTGRELLPSHDLACSIYIRTDLPSQELDLQTALKYLRKENLDRDHFTQTNTGWCLVRYEGVNLGWVKVLPNRVNNYYPKEVRIMNL